MKKIFVMIYVLCFMVGAGICQAEITDPAMANETDLFTPYQDGTAPDSIARDLVKDGVIPEEQSGDIRVGTPDIRDKPITRSQAIAIESTEVKQPRKPELPKFNR